MFKVSKQKNVHVLVQKDLVLNHPGPTLPDWDDAQAEARGLISFYPKLDKGSDRA